MIFWVKRSKVNLPAALWLHFIYGIIFLRLLITDASNFVQRWRMVILEDTQNIKGQKVYWWRSVLSGCFPKELLSLQFLVTCASFSGSYIRFVNRVWWTFYVLEYSVSMTSIILQYPKGEIPCKFLQIDLPKFRFTELRSKSAILLKQHA